MGPASLGSSSGWLGLEPCEMISSLTCSGQLKQLGRILSPLSFSLSPFLPTSVTIVVFTHDYLGLSHTIVVSSGKSNPLLCWIASSRPNLPKTKVIAGRSLWPVLDVLQYYFCHILVVYSEPAQVQSVRGQYRDLDPRRCDVGEKLRHAVYTGLVVPWFEHSAGWLWRWSFSHAACRKSEREDINI